MAFFHFSFSAFGNCTDHTLSTDSTPNPNPDKVTCLLEVGPPLDCVLRQTKWLVAFSFPVHHPSAVDCLLARFNRRQMSAARREKARLGYNNPYLRRQTRHILADSVVETNHVFLFFPPPPFFLISFVVATTPNDTSRPRRSDGFGSSRNRGGPRPAPRSRRCRPRDPSPASPAASSSGVRSARSLPRPPGSTFPALPTAPTTTTCVAWLCENKGVCVCVFFFWGGGVRSRGHNSPSSATCRPSLSITWWW